jgi:hypothetical protein
LDLNQRSVGGKLLWAFRATLHLENTVAAVNKPFVFGRPSEASLGDQKLTLGSTVLYPRQIDRLMPETTGWKRKVEMPNFFPATAHRSDAANANRDSR